MGLSLSGMGRFSEPALLILESLADGAKHGYAMMDDIRHRHEVDLGAGTLYGAIARLEAAGLIEPLAPEQRRRPYQLTKAGAEALQVQLQALHRFVAEGLVRLVPS